MSETRLGERLRATAEGAALPSGTPSPAPVLLDLDPWLDATAWKIPGAGVWEVPVPAPFAFREGRLVAFPGPPDPAKSFRPREVPWLASEFAHLGVIASEEETREGREAVQRDAYLGFADRFGLTGPWTDSQPPRERQIRTMVLESLKLHRALSEWRKGVSSDTEPERAKEAARIAWQSVWDVRLPGLSPGRLLGVVGSYPEPLDLLDIMRLQLLADFMAGRAVHECEFSSPRTGPCGKLFIWTEGSTGSRIRGRGQPPRFCSRRHAAAAGQRRRRQRKERE